MKRRVAKLIRDRKAVAGSTVAALAELEALGYKKSQATLDRWCAGTYYPDETADPYLAEWIGGGLTARGLRKMIDAEKKPNFSDDEDDEDEVPPAVRRELDEIRAELDAVKQNQSSQRSREAPPSKRSAPPRRRPKH